MTKSRRVAVVGAGVIGLSTAYKILQENKNVNVTVFYDKSSPDTTGDVSAGWVCPFTWFGDEADIRRWYRTTFDYLSELFKEKESLEIGVAPITGFIMDPDEATLRILEGDLRLATEADKKSFLPWKETDRTVYWYTTWTCHCPNYLPWLTKKIVALSGQFEKKEIVSFSQLSDFDIVVNCSGLGARKLVPDNKVYPVKGQVFTVEAPWIKHFYDVNHNTYILPRLHDVILGGTHRSNDFSEGLDPKESRRIFEECCKFVPSLRNAKIISENYGYRPARNPIRLEVEKKRNNGGQYIVHNYGHAGSGVTLHWGCAIDASNLVKNLLKVEPARASKL